MKIALISLDQLWEDKTQNLKQCRHYIADAAELGADMVIFPEMTLTGFSMNAEALAEPKATSETIQAFTKLALQHKVAIAFGVILKDPQGIFNSFCIINKFGQLQEIYSKIHPFSLLGEDKVYTAGDRLVVIELDGFHIGLTICYDLRFPELYSALAKRCDAIINIANWPEKRVDHWLSLLKARAIENQKYIIGVNRTGTDGNGLSYQESSVAFNANGDLLPCEQREDLKLFDIDQSWTSDYQEKFNTFVDRREQLYQQFFE